MEREAQKDDVEINEAIPQQDGIEKDQSNGHEETKNEGGLHKRFENRNSTSGQEDDLRICIQGVREFTKDFEIVKDLDKMFGDQDLGIEAIIKEPNRSFFFLKFRDQLSKDKFFSKGGFSLRNRELKVKNAQVSRSSLKKERTLKDIRQFVEKRSEVAKSKIAGQDQELDQTQHTKESISEAIKQRICGYGEKPYEEQIELKKKKLVDYLVEIKKLAKERVKSEDSQVMEWLRSNDVKCCELKDFIECPEGGRQRYRTKSEFTIGTSALDKLPKVGFNISDHKKKYHSIELTDTADELMTIPTESFLVARHSEELIRSLDWPIFDRGTLKGFWRFVVVRVSKETKEMVVNFVCNQTYFEEGKFADEFSNKFVKVLAERLTKLQEFDGIKIVGITFQHSDSSNDCIPSVEDEEIVLFYGESKTYHEVINGCRFEVSSSSFLQINISQSESMYEYARKCVGLDEKTILLDICSGIGTIGISVGKECHKVVGIEMVKSACANALKNAKNNGMEEKYEVVEGKVEDRIEEVAQKYSAQGFKIVGIIDPPRAGLHPDVVRTIRTCKGLDNLIFICCDIKQSKTNIIDLCLPQNKKRRGPPFSPIFCSGVDMFPQTPHFESLFVLKRLYEEIH